MSLDHLNKCELKAIIKECLYEFITENLSCEARHYDGYSHHSLRIKNPDISKETYSGPELLFEWWK